MHRPSPTTAAVPPPAIEAHSGQLQVDAPASRERRSRLRHRQLILDAARNEFAAKGFSGCQTLDIALRAGVPKANLYYYFHTKENLYAEVLQPLLEPLRLASLLLHEDADPSPALKAYIEARVQIVQGFPLRSKILCSELLHGAQQLPRTWRESLEAQNRSEIDCLRRWAERGLIAAIDPEHLLLFIGAATQTYPTLGWQIALMNHNNGPSAEDFQGVAATLTRMVLGGALPASDSRPELPARALAI
ncbi:TetR/AcrR family transcriptional regulator [Pseudomonas sp. Fl4BN1]|uniref:TetR/AcrR family transcriptional regulator n=1 Tax=Pseudomonas sp. Fl4BN1 TaxID=2697651 RepID=UPI0015B5D206|nr:TetR/AcrR family transcriptional regulator [Pseudomonas sp. Fl4BN1]